MGNDAAVVLVNADSATGTAQASVVQTEKVSGRLASDSEGRPSRGKIRQVGDDSVHTVVGHQSTFSSAAATTALGGAGESSHKDDVCVTRKQTFAKSAPRVKRSAHETAQPGDVLHVDIIVWSRPLSIPNGNRYTLAIRDVHTRWGEVVHMTRKSDALKAL